MSKTEIRRILARKPTAAPSECEALRRGIPNLIPFPDEEVDEDKVSLYCWAKEFYETEERDRKLQDRVREEMRITGFVEMDDDWVRGRAEVQAAIEEAWKEIEALLESETQEEDDYDSDDSDWYSSEALLKGSTILFEAKKQIFSLFLRSTANESAP